MADLVSKVFERALAAREDVTGTFFAEFGFDAAQSRSMIESETVVLKRVRDVMESTQGGGYLFALTGEAAPFAEQANELINSGRVAAVDGTVAVSKIEFMNTGLYACAIGWVTSQHRGKPEIIITRTSSAYLNPTNIRNADDADLAAICNELDEARDSESWPTTFREYEERRVAIENCPADAVFIDGPIFTQNLLTQHLGRDLLERLIMSSKMFIGIIKNLNSSWALCRWCAAALKPGEGYIVCPIGEPIRDRKSIASQSELLGWLSKTDEFVRVVFRPAEKAFAFECRRCDVGLATALILANASPTLQHELPLLLETIDAQLRAGFDAATARNAVLNRIMLEKDGYQPAIDAIDEREFR
jgi:NurA domain